MKWTLPDIGEKRTRRGFRFTPLIIGNLVTWLQFVTWEETFVEDGLDNVWKPTRILKA